MIDTGDIEHRDQIVALLHKYKVKEISKIIITHPHADHLGGMNAIFKISRWMPFTMTACLRPPVPTKLPEADQSE